jgi:hypothetical protein
VRFVTVAGLIVMTGLAGFGCGGPAPAGSRSDASDVATKPPRPAQLIDQLRAGFADLASNPHEIQTADNEGTTVTAVLDPPSRRSTVVLKQAGAVFMEFIIIESDTYLRFGDAPGALFTDGIWRHMTGARTPGIAAAFAVTGSADIRTFGNAILSVESINRNAYRGTMDLTRTRVINQTLEQFPDGGRSVPFEVETDPSNHPMVLTYTVPASGTEAETPVRLQLRLTSQPNIQTPNPDKVVEAPDLLYRLFDG